MKRNILLRFYGISHACANSGAQAVFSLPRKKRPGNEANPDLASFPGRFCGGEEKRPGHHCWRMRVVPIKTWEFVHVCTLSAYTLVIFRNTSVHDCECLSVLLQLRERLQDLERSCVLKRRWICLSWLIMAEVSF